VHSLRQAQGGLVGLPLRGVRVFRQFWWLEAGSGKVAFIVPGERRDGAQSRPPVPLKGHNADR